MVGQSFGYLVFGIEDGTHNIIGTKFKPLEEKIGNEEIEFWLSRMLLPRIDFRIYEFQYQGKAIVLFHIPASVGQPTSFQNISDDRIEISNPGLPIVEPIRFIDGYNARNTLLASAMRRMGFCEEKGSDIDKVVAQCELFQLPAPDFKTSLNQTIAILFAHQDLNDMGRKDKIRATYQHCCLMYVTNQKITNQTLRERFKIEEQNYSIASRIIKEAISEELIKQEDPENNSRKYMSYIPFWA